MIRAGGANNLRPGGPPSFTKNRYRVKKGKKEKGRGGKDKDANPRR